MTQEQIIAETSTPEELDMMRQEAREQVMKVVSGALDRCTTLDEIQKFYDMSIALSGLLLETKRGTNG